MDIIFFNLNIVLILIQPFWIFCKGAFGVVMFIQVFEFILPCALSIWAKYFQIINNTIRFWISFHSGLFSMLSTNRTGFLIMQPVGDTFSTKNMPNSQIISSSSIKIKYPQPNLVGSKKTSEQIEQDSWESIWSEFTKRRSSLLLIMDCEWSIKLIDFWLL